MLIDFHYRFTPLKADVLKMTEHKENINPNDTPKIIKMNSNNILFRKVQAKEIDPLYMPDNYSMNVWHDKLQGGIKFVNIEPKENVQS